MKFDYCRGVEELTYLPEYYFKFALTEDEVEKVLHKHGTAYRFEYDLFPPSIDENHKIWTSIQLITECFSGDKPDLGVDYKKKYEELCELLEPHRIDEDMSPATTLKMLLKYKVNPDTP